MPHINHDIIFTPNYFFECRFIIAILSCNTKYIIFDHLVIRKLKHQPHCKYEYCLINSCTIWQLKKVAKTTHRIFTVDVSVSMMNRQWTLKLCLTFFIYFEEGVLDYSIYLYFHINVLKSILILVIYLTYNVLIEVYNTLIPLKTSFSSRILRAFNANVFCWYPSWSFPHNIFNRVIAMMTTRLPKVATPISCQTKKSPRAVIVKKDTISYWNWKASWILWQSTDIRLTMSPTV